MRMYIAASARRNQVVVLNPIALQNFVFCRLFMELLVEFEAPEPLPDGRNRPNH